ncbi:HTTM domain-containing protein [Hymenobacter metallicola]|uniref:HTTM-like domain-containing protein n=1 Tax=Hymenobacter metallicola TaxID=2563114 RepID=A0A4Z0QEG0_9BACT|nr:HTTM domain-containing protein [Hymenobacter metallicola]TGE27421.1 hypothetical protein E5K02_13660 [Hymenobacter metallicola]
MKTLSNDTSSIGLSIYRVILSFLVMKNMIFYYGMADSLFGANAIANYSIYQQAMGASFFRYLEYPFYLPHASQLFVVLIFVLAFLFLFGIYQRVVGTVFFAALMILNMRNNFILDGSDNVIQVTLPFLVLAHSYRHFIYDVRLRGLERFQDNKVMSALIDVVTSLATRGLMIQVCFIYFFTAVAKMQGTMWLNGTATYYTMRVEEFRQTDWNIPLTSNHYFVVLSTYFTVLWELSFAFLVWFRQTRNIVLLCGVLLHVGIWVFMRIDNFSWIMIGTYFVFVPDREYQLVGAYFTKWLNRLKGALGRVTTAEPAGLEAQVQAVEVPQQ